MTMPSQTEIEIPLLKALNELGGKGKPKDIYPLVTKQFNLTESELNEKMESGGNKWTNRIQWTRQKLIDRKEIESPDRGIWQISEEGKKRINNTNKNNISKTVEIINEFKNFVEMYDEYEEDFKSQLLDNLHELTPRQFEEFSKKLLQVYGFVDLSVTKTGPDGGIDGYGKLQVGLATMSVAFQCKRWQGNVGSKEVQQFRGAIQGEYQQGIFFTTSDFTPNAKNESIKKGAVPVILLNGNSIIKIMIEKGLGVEKKPLYLFYEKVSDFLESEN